jgi:hypothetical protein
MMCGVGSHCAGVLAAFAAMVLMGCATEPSAVDAVSAAQSALASAPLCCSFLADAPRSPLPLQSTLVSIGIDRPVFAFNGQRAFFVLYELPAFSAPYSILVESQPVDMPTTYEKGGGLFGASSATAKTLMAVAIAMLDAGFSQQRVFDSGTMRPRGEGLEQTVFVNDSNATERYIAIYGVDRREVVSKTYSNITVTPVMAGGVVGTMIGGEDRTGRIHFSPTGVLRLTVSGLAPAGVR